MDKPLNTWSYEELRQKMDLIAQALDGSIDLPNEAVDATPAFDNAHAAGQDTAQPVPTMMKQFSIMREHSLKARRIDFPAAILPGEALMIAPDRIEDSGFVEAVACPFMLVGNSGYRFWMEEADFIRWSLISLVEQTTYGFLTMDF